MGCRFLIVWTSFLPFALFSKFQWLTPFVAAMITFLLFGVRCCRSVHMIDAWQCRSSFSWHLCCLCSPVHSQGFVQVGT